MLHKLTKATGELLSEPVLVPNPGYRMAIGIFGVALPPALFLWTGFDALQNSIIAYYYTRGRDWFVCTLWVVGVFLFFYQYKPRHSSNAKSEIGLIRSGLGDAYLGKFAGVSALAVALLPTTPPEGLSNQPPIIGMSHGAAAFVLFLSLSLFPLALFSQSRDHVRIYKWAGWLMVIFLALIAAYASAPETVRVSLAPLRPVLVLESLLIWTFGFSWFAKGLAPAINEHDAASDAISDQAAV